MYSIGSQPSLFVSHSRYDADSVSYFSKIFANAGIKARFMEWEKLEGKYAGSRIADIVRSNVMENVRVVIVLLGKNLKSPPTESPQFTHNWVNFEVGVSAGCKKPVWVFEEFDEDVNFPIPYVTDFAKYRLEDVDHLRVIGEILRDIISYNTARKAPFFVECPHKNCNAKYNFWSENLKEFSCPVCRQKINIQ